MEPQNTIQNSLKWRIWHSANYVFGAVCFLFGSLLLFPYFATVFNSALISAWLYTVGSLTFTFSDLTQWIHYQKAVYCKQQAKFCMFPGLSTNFFISVIGSFIYFVGSALFIPAINKLQLGLYMFITGSTMIVISQSWKLIRVIREGSKKNKICSTIKQDTDGFLVDAFAAVGGACYFTGSFLFFNPDPFVQLAACTVFSCGGFCFFSSGAFMLSRYFLRNAKYQGAVSIATTQAKFQNQNQQSTVQEKQSID